MEIQAGDLGISANHIFPNRLTCDDMWWFRTKNDPWMFVLGDLQSHPNPSAKMTAGANCAKFLIRPGWPRSKVARSYFIGRHEVLFTGLQCSEETLLFTMLQLASVVIAWRPWNFEVESCKLHSDQNQCPIAPQHWSKFCATWSFFLQ
jgi:hypothetical protein